MNEEKTTAGVQATDAISLAGWRRAVAELYAAVRETDDRPRAWQAFVDGRNELFKEHTQTPLLVEQQRNFRGLSYYKYDPDMRAMGRIKYDVEPEVFRVELGDNGLFQFQRVDTIQFRLADRPLYLNLYWIFGYGGGLFLPFKDASSGVETYGGGRYLYDTIKGADLGAYWGSIVLDFNFAYNPYCEYSSAYSCPLPLAENWLTVPILAGEKKFR